MRSILKVFFFGLVFFLNSFLFALAGGPCFNSDVENQIIPRLNSMASPITGDFLVNDDAGSAGQWSPDIAIDGSGNFVIVWEDYRNGNPDIYAQRYDSYGNPLGGNFKVNDDTGSFDQKNPAVAMDTSGNFVITWTDQRKDYWNPDIYAQRYDSWGTPRDTNFDVSDYGTGSPDICIDGSGNFVITWGQGDIYYQRYDSSATRLGSNIKVNDDTGTAYQMFPAIYGDHFGNFIITWLDGRKKPYDIYAQRYSSSGNILGINFQVNDSSGTAYDGSSPAIATDKSHNFVITWSDTRNAHLEDIYAQRFNSLGIPLGSNFRVNESDVGTIDQYDPAIGVVDSGNSVIVWENDPGGNSDIYAQRYDLSWNPISSNYLVNNPQTSSQKQPSVGANNSNIYYTWVDFRNGNSDIYAKIVDWNWTKVREDREGNLLSSFTLSQNYPNPFNQSTKIEFILSHSGFASLNIYNLLGRKIRTLVSDKLTAGYNSVFWDGKDDSGKEVASGIYFYQLKVGDYSNAKKLLLLK